MNRNPFVKNLAVVVFLLIATELFAQQEKRPNILLIISDDLRTELNCYGESYIKSPNIDKLASKGTVFTSAYVQQAVCSASRASFLTGARPNTTGVDYPYSEYFVNTFWPAHPAIAEYFERQNYEVRTFGKIHHGPQDKIKATNYVPKGLKFYATEENIKLGGQKGRSKETPPFEMADVPDEAYQDGMIAAEAVKVIKEVSGKKQPFFLAVGFKKPHLPFCAPKKYWDMYSDNDIKLAVNPELPEGAPSYAVYGKELNSYKIPAKVNGEFTEDYQRTLKHAYAACVSYVDAQVGKLMASLEESGALGNTIVVFMSDHGWHLGEQGTWGKHTNFELATRAPLIVSVPGKAEGKRLNQFVEYVDIYPTLLELAGFEPADYLEGNSFVPLLDNPDREWKSAAFSQFPRNGFEGFAIRTKDFRYVEWRSDKDSSIMSVELYDHRTDPLETKNVASDKKYEKSVKEMAERLKAGWKAALPAGIINLSDNKPAPSAVGWGPEAKAGNGG
ncbi:MAG: sulfatase [Chitinophagaceae bacterium]|nr:sulfatase [Chitinophagaceae bacterium]